jgi:hypothetical protein
LIDERFRIFGGELRHRSGVLSEWRRIPYWILSLSLSWLG